MAELAVKKMKQGMSYTCKEKTIILNVFKYFRAQHPDKCVTDIVRRTAKATGCSEKSVFQFRKEEASAEGFREPSRTKVRKNININSRDIKYDGTVRATIRHVIYDLKYRNIVPSLNTILKQVNADTRMPNFSLMTLRRLMFDMGFSYQKTGNKSVLVEKPDSRYPGEMPMAPAPLDLPPPPPVVPSGPDPRLLAPPPMHMAEHHPPPMMPQGDLGHPQHMLHKAMPMMVGNQRPPPPPPPAMDMHRKREPMAPWMHGLIKQGQ